MGLSLLVERRLDVTGSGWVEENAMFVTEQRLFFEVIFPET